MRCLSVCIVFCAIHDLFNPRLTRCCAIHTGRLSQHCFVVSGPMHVFCSSTLQQVLSHTYRLMIASFGRHFGDKIVRLAHKSGLALYCLLRFSYALCGRSAREKDLFVCSDTGLQLVSMGCTPHVCVAVVLRIVSGEAYRRCLCPRTVLHCSRRHLCPPTLVRGHKYRRL